MLNKSEFPHHTPSQVREYLATALALTEELDPPEDLRPLVFAKAAELFSSKQIVMQEVQAAIPNLAIPRERVR